MRTLIARLKKDLSRRWHENLFSDEKLISSTPFVETPVPEHPWFMKQPSPDAQSAWHLRSMKADSGFITVYGVVFVIIAFALIAAQL